MTHISPEKLEEAIKIAEENLGGWGPSDLRRTQRMLLDVAKAHLATLPHFKEVEVEQWAVVATNGAICASFKHEHAAIAYVKDCEPACQVVRLTGTAKVRA